MDFANSQTFSCLQAAYHDELMASAQYRLYASCAEEEGKRGVSLRFARMADRAMTHAAVCMRLINGNDFPSTLENLRSAARCEFGEWTHKYTAYAKTAREEGFSDLSELFDRMAGIARYHNVCFCGLADALKEDLLFLREEDTVWICLACGYAHTDISAPISCPVCGKPQGWFEDMKDYE